MKKIAKPQKWVKVNDRPNTWIEVDADIPDSVVEERFLKRLDTGIKIMHHKKGG